MSHRATARRPMRASAVALALLLLAPMAGSQARAGAKEYPGWVSNSKDGTVSVLDLTNFTVLNTIAVGKLPKGIDGAGDGTAVVAVQGADQIAVLDAAAGVIQQIPTGHKPIDAAVDPRSTNGGIAALFADSAIQWVGQLGPGGTMAVDRRPTAVAYDPKGKQLAVACSGTGTAYLVPRKSLPGQAKVATLNVGAKPMALAFDRKGRELVVTSLKDGTVTIINAKKQKIEEGSDVGGGPWGVAFSPTDKNVAALALSKGKMTARTDGSPAAKAKGNVVAIFVKETPTLVQVGKSPRGIAFTPDGKLLLVANFKSKSVSVIDVATKAVVATIPVGVGPYDVATTAKE